MKWFRAGKSRGPLTGYVVTWDVDSRDPIACAQLQRSIYGYTSIHDGKEYRYPGFVEREGVRYLGQSVLLVPLNLVSELVETLARIGVDFDFQPGSVG